MAVCQRTALEVLMVKLALLARMEAKPGKAEEAAAFLASALPLALQEPATTLWFAWRIGPSTFGISTHSPMRQAVRTTLPGKSRRR